jgi:conjugal transfer pilus assembly protein TrbC
VLRVLIIVLFWGVNPLALADSDVILENSEKAMNQAMEFVPDRIEFTHKTTVEALKQSTKALTTLEKKKPVLPSMPKLDLMNIPARSSVDIGLLSQQGKTLMGSVNEQTSRYESQILIFVSASMPVKTVKSYLLQTQHIGAALVFRGLVNDSMKDMQLYLSSILGAEQTDKKPTILIDPTLYNRFDIKQVPTTVVTESEIKPCQASGCPTPVFHQVSGDVSLAWALGLVSRQIESDTLKATLRPLIKDLEML